MPAKEQFDAIATLIKDKVIRCAGLSEVSVADIEAASKVFPVATVQNRYNFIDRASEDALDHCEKNAIGFIPWAPLDAGAPRGRAPPWTRSRTSTRRAPARSRSRGF